MTTQAGDHPARDDDFAISVAILRLIRAMNQAELARASGVTNSAISDYERGKVDPQTSTMRRLFRGLDLPIAVLDETRAFILRIRSQVGAEESRKLHLGALDGAGALDEVAVPAQELAIWAEVAILSAEGGRFVARLIRLLFLTLFWLGRAVPRHRRGAAGGGASQRGDDLWPAVDRLQKAAATTAGSLRQEFEERMKGKP